MTVHTDSKCLTQGERFTGQTRLMSTDRIGWYADALRSSILGRPERGYADLHTDEEQAKAQGFDRPIADGMISTNWIFAMLLDQFGQAVLTGSSLRTKYIKPIYRDQLITPFGRVREIHDSDEGVKYVLDVWCEDEDGVRRCDGEASVLVPDRVVGEGKS